MADNEHRIYTTSVASVYPYVTKAVRTGRTKAEVDEIVSGVLGAVEIRERGRSSRTRNDRR